MSLSLISSREFRRSEDATSVVKNENGLKMCRPFKKPIQKSQWRNDRYLPLQILDVDRRMSVNKMPVCRRPVGIFRRFGCAIVVLNAIVATPRSNDFKIKRTRKINYLFVVLLFVDVHQNCRLNTAASKFGDGIDLLAIKSLKTTDFYTTLFF